MDGPSEAGASQQPAGRPKPYLLGGTGWQRRASALQGGGRYVPKGGHIVDFSAPGSTKSAFSGLGASIELAGEEEAAAPSLPARWAERIALRHTHDVLRPTSPPGDYLNQGKQAGGGLDRYDEVPPPRPSALRGNGLGGDLARREWRPPGPVTPTRSVRLVGGARRGLGGAAGGARRKGARAPAPAPHDCANCECCAEARSALEAAEAAARQDRADAAALRRRLDAALAALARERAEFEAFKDAEVAAIRAAVAEAARRQQRDRLAAAAGARAAAKGSDAALSQDRAAAEVEALRTELEAAQREAGRAEGRHRVERERLRREVARLERQCGDLAAGAAAAEAERLQAWEEATRAKAEAGALKGRAQAEPKLAAAEEEERAIFEDAACVEDTFKSAASSEASEDPGAAAPPPPAAAPPPSAAADPEVVAYPNGTVRRAWLDGHAVTAFSNGDIKQEYPSGAVEYFFGEMGVWQVTHPASGVETFFFPCGRVESHLPDGAKDTLLPGGAGATRAAAGGAGDAPVPVTALRRETLAPKPAPLRAALTH